MAAATMSPPATELASLPGPVEPDEGHAVRIVPPAPASAAAAADDRRNSRREISRGRAIGGDSTDAGQPVASAPERQHSPTIGGAMPEVATLRGPVDVEQLGVTLMHEHVFVLTTDWLQNYGPGSFWSEDEQVANAIEKLEALRAKGVTTIVDPTVIGLGRYIPRLLAVAESVEMHIIPATGVYTYHDLPFAYTQRGPGTVLDGPEPMIEDFTRDIVEGIADTGVKAAFLKCAVEHADMSAGVERVLRAVAQTHNDTGAPITVHTSAAEQTARLVVKILQEEGADLTKVVLGHVGDSTDVDYLMELADSGAILGMDRFGIDVFCPTDDRVRTVVALAERGYADRMVLSHDASFFIDWFGPDFVELRDAVMPNWTYEHISDDVLPALREQGVTDAQIDQMVIENP
jgi:phosphotriesterase-related protein